MNKLSSRLNELHHQHRWFTPVVIILITVFTVFLLVSTKPTPPKQATPEKEWLVETETIAFKPATPQLNLLGQVANPFDSILSAGIVADVAEVPVRQGMRVNRGDTLIRLDAQEIRLIVEQREADVAELKAQIVSEKNRYASDQTALEEEQRLLTIAENGVKRQASLKASNLVAQERFDQADSQRAQTALAVNARKLQLADHPSRLAQLTARLKRAETLLNDALLDAQRTEINAPFDGMVTAVTVSPGERVQIGQALVSMYDINSMELHAQIPDRRVAEIKQALAAGQIISAQTSRFGRTYQLVLQRLAGQVNQGSGGINAIFLPTNSEHDFVLNTTVEVLVNLPALDMAVTLPLSALYGGNRIYRIEDGRLQSINIQVVGKQLDPAGKQDRAIIESKLLKAGDVIAITQLPNAISGLKVKARN
jgi:multidrug resistance efflux pump